MDWFADFSKLPSAHSAADFSAVRLSTQRHDFLAKSTDGSPVFLLHDESSANYSPAIELKNVSVQFQVTCRVTVASGSVEGQFAVIVCNSTAPELHELFVSCFASAVEQLPVGSKTADLLQCIQGLLDLFRSLDRPSGREITGLWAELFVITRCSNIGKALSAWHEDQNERFDFSWATGLLEVKATTKDLRQHEFSLEQLQIPLGGDGFVASVLLQPANGGVGVVDLAKIIERAVPSAPKLRLKLWGNVAATLGKDFSERLDRRFDTNYAERSLTIFSMRDIPTPPRSSDPRITGIRFRVDLSTVKSSLPGSVREMLKSIFN